MAIKWNWGTGIVIAFALFITFITYIVIQGFRQNIDLVSDTYYLEELHFQDRITQKSNLANSGLNLQVSQDQANIVVTFPREFSGSEGKIYFYHPSRELFDKTYEIALSADQSQVISKEDLIQGHYKVKVEWVANEVPYFQEMALLVR
ncbi:MAG: hypothetical protein ACI83W_001674 [Marinoscillum sp.]|jgi:hypothetical protein